MKETCLMAMLKNFHSRFLGNDRKKLTQSSSVADSFTHVSNQCAVTLGVR